MKRACRSLLTPGERRLRDRMRQRLRRIEKVREMLSDELKLIEIGKRVVEKRLQKMMREYEIDMRVMRLH